MSSQRYERVRRNLATPDGIRIEGTTMLTSHQVSNNEPDTPITPSSPPPSFRSRASSPTSRHLLSDASPVDQNLADTFDADGSDSDEENDGDDRQRLMRGTPASSTTENAPTPPTTESTPAPPPVERRPTYLPAFTPTTTRVYGGGSGSDGVFANLSAKPETGEKMEEHPPVSHIRLRPGVTY
jgi:hypothetical protein